MKKTLFLISFIGITTALFAQRDWTPSTWPGQEFVKNGLPNNPKLGDHDETTGFLFENPVSKDKNGVIDFPMAIGINVIQLNLWFYESGVWRQKNVRLLNAPKDVDGWLRACVNRKRIGSDGNYDIPVQLNLSRDIVQQQNGGSAPDYYCMF